VIWVHRRRMSKDELPRYNPRNNGSQKGPLRRVQELIAAGTGKFAKDVVLLECGHRGKATVGAVRARCAQCKEELSLAP
jgi:hypothetical protein